MSISDLLEKGKRNHDKSERNTALRNAALGAAVGVTAGVAAGVLLAPKTGEETRKSIVKAAKELPEKLLHDKVMLISQLRLWR